MRTSATNTSAGRALAVAALASALAALALFMAMEPAKAQGAGSTFTVDRSDDRPITAIPQPGDTCTGASNDCTLRDALANSNVVPGTDTIDFSVDEVTLSVPGRENQGATGDLDILDSVTIDGGDGVVISGAGLDADRVFDISSPAIATVEFVTVKDGGTVMEGGSDPQTSGGGFLVREGAELILRDSTVENNKAVSTGGGIDIFGPSQGSSLAGGKATLERSTVSGNETTSSQQGFGGGIYVDAGAELTLSDLSLVIDNETLIAGGGIYLSNPPTGSGIAGGAATVEDSIVDDNKITSPQGGGGGIAVGDGATLDLTDSEVAGNESASVSGGIASRGATTVERSTVSDNTAVRLAGGIGSGATEGNVVPGNVLTVDSSTISGNTARAAGGLGAISSPATVTNSTISGNTANGTPEDSPPSAGGGVAVAGVASLTLDHVTVAENKAPNTAGGGLGIAPGNPATIEARNTIVANNTQAAGGQCFGTVTSVGTNLEFPASTCEFQINKDPKLGPLTDNGGPTLTHALGRRSAAKNAATECPPPATDQRGVERPKGKACDIGAFEKEKKKKKRR